MKKTQPYVKLSILCLITVLFLGSIQLGSGEETIDISNYVKKSDDSRWASKNICLVGCSTPQNPDECECATVYEIIPKNLVGSKGIKLDYNNFWTTFRSKNDMSLTASVNQNSDWEKVWYWVNVSRIGHDIEYDGRYYICGKWYDEEYERWYDKTCYNNTIIKDETYIYEGWEPFKFDKILLSKNIKIGVTGEKKLGSNVDHILNFKINNQNYALKDYDWWNSTWQKRKNITIIEEGGISKTNELNYIYSISGDFAGQGCAVESRLIDSEGSLATYDILNSTSTTCKIAFLNSISSSATEVFGFYYDPDTSVASAETNFLHFYDDFNDSTKVGGPGSQAYNGLGITNYNGLTIDDIVSIGTNKVLRSKGPGYDEFHVVQWSISTVPIGGNMVYCVYDVLSAPGADMGFGFGDGVTGGGWDDVELAGYPHDASGQCYKSEVGQGSLCSNCQTQGEPYIYYSNINIDTDIGSVKIYNKANTLLGSINPTMNGNSWSYLISFINGPTGNYMDMDRFALTNQDFNLYHNRSIIIVGPEEEGNTPPILSSIDSISSNGLNTTVADLIGDYVYYDEDSNPQSANETKWFKNTVEQGSLANSMSVDSSYTTKGENWVFSARVNDGTEWSGWYNSTGLTILNTPPTISVIDLVSSDGTNGTNADLIGNYTFSDIDTDSEANKETKWYKSSIEQVVLANLMSIASGNTTKGDSWIFGARVNDGTVWSNWYNSSILTIINSIPTAPSLNSPANGTSFAEVKELNWTNSNDADSDTLTYRLELDDNSDFSSLIYLNESIAEDTSGITGDPNVMVGLNIADDKTYYWRTRANDGEENSAWSDVWNFVYAMWNITFDIRDSFTNEQLSDVNITCDSWNNVDTTEELSVETGMVGLWHMNEESGTIEDSSANGNYGTTYGDITYGVNGRFNTALDFDGNGDYISAGMTNFPTGNQDISIATWFKINDLNSDNAIVHYGKNTANNAIQLVHRTSDDTIRVQYWGGYGAAATSLTDTNWHHVVAIHANNTNYLYLDGEFKDSTSYTNANLIANFNDIGKVVGYSSYDFDGTIDEVTIYNRTLSIEEIQEDYQKGVPHYIYSHVFTPGNYDCIARKDEDYYKKIQSFTADQDKTVTITLSQDEGLTEEEHTWLEALHECVVEEDCHLLNLLEQINQTVDAVWEVTKKTDETVVNSESVISYEVSESSNLTIDYTINVPIKQGYSIGDYLPIRIGYWFMNAANTTCYNQGDKPTGVENPYCQPLITQTLGPMGGSTSFTVDLRPELPAGTYTLIREIDIDPNELWTNYGREAIGKVIINELNEIASISLASDYGIETQEITSESTQVEEQRTKETLEKLEEKVDSLTGITGNLAKELEGKGSLFFTIGIFVLITLIMGYFARKRIKT